MTLFGGRLESMNHIKQLSTQMSLVTAILAVALLCAQTIVVSHTHDAAEDAQCVVCGTSSTEAAAAAPAAPRGDTAESSGGHVSHPSAPIFRTLRSVNPRAPPVL
jgi:hypothetical protein